MAEITPIAGSLGNHAQGVQKLNFRYGRSMSGTNPSTDISAGPGFKFNVTINGDGPHLVQLPAWQVLKDGNAIATAIENGVRGVIATDPELNNAFRQARAIYAEGQYWIVSGLHGDTSSVVITDSGADNIAVALKLGVANGGSESYFYPLQTAFATYVDFAEKPVPVKITEATVELNADIDASSLYPNAPTIANVSVLTASTEYSYALPANTRLFSVKVRGNSKLQLAFTSGQSGTNFITVEMGNRYVQNDVILTSGLTLYFQTSVAAQTVEILSWTQ